MSQKITAKNLTYDTTLPPFLARLRGQQSSRSGPDPILAANRRPGQKRSASEEAEDAPVVVDEHGNVVYLKDGELGLDRESSDKEEKSEENSIPKAGTEDNEDGDPAPGKEKEKEKEKVAGIGASRKRKVGRVVGEEQSGDEKEGRGVQSKRKSKTNAEAEAQIAKASADVRRLVHGAEGGEEASRSQNHSNDVRKSANAAGDKSDQQQKTIKSTKRKPAKKIKLSFGDNDDGE
ncbi:hypothetical protein GGR51DRAFT_47379 [Nemania sp. FL0031]|nr:hypothetical protein GGR51DRAFT_47379 [Nemania sp. FL0031]